jgi:hypothetical protein
LGFVSMLKGEKPQSSVEPIRCFDILGCGHQLVAHFLRRFCTRALRDDTAYISHLRDPFSVIPQVFADQLIADSRSRSLAISI